MTPPRAFVEFQLRDWTSIPIEHVAEGIERQMVWGDRVMVCRLRFVPHTVTAVHSHPHEQVTLVERGRVEFFVDGQRRIASAGDVLVFPSNIQHGATILEEEVILVDIFSPLREDFLKAADRG